MGPAAWGRAAQALKFALVAVAAGYALAVLALAAVRVPYPFELEWMEGGSLQQLQRILSGRQLYVAPSLEFIPFIYPPLYFYVSAALAKVVGAGFVPLRLVSLAASLGSAALIAAIVRREGGSRLPGVLAGCLFLATYRFSGAWFDVGRVDALFLCLFLAALYAARFYPSVRGGVAAGALLALAYLTKQLALAMALPLIAAASLANWRRGAAMAAALAALAGGATWALDALHGGWYRFYIFETLTRHAVETRMWVDFWTRDLARPLAIAGVAAIAYLAVRWRAGDRERAIFYLAAGVAMVGGSYASRLNFGGYANVLLWGYAWLAILAGLAFQARSQAAASDAARGDRLRSGLYAVAIAQFALLAYQPLAHVPTAEDAAAGQAVVQRLRGLPGPVWVPYHPYLATMAGHPDLAHGMASIELLWGHGPVVDGLRRELDAAIAGRRFGAVVLDAGWFPPELRAGVVRGYAPAGALLRQPKVFYPVTGMSTRPESLYLKESPP